MAERDAHDRADPDRRVGEPVVERPGEPAGGGEGLDAGDHGPGHASRRRGDRVRARYRTRALRRTAAERTVGLVPWKKRSMKVLHRLAVLGSLGAILLAAAAVPGRCGRMAGRTLAGGRGIGDPLYPASATAATTSCATTSSSATPRATPRADRGPHDPARATQSLSRFNLDFAGGGVGDGPSTTGRRLAARWQELVVTPGPCRSPTVRGRRRFRRDPTAPDPDNGRARSSQRPMAARGRPSPPARTGSSRRTTIRVTRRASRSDRRPRRDLAVANGELVGQERGRPHVSRYLQRQPMATELISSRSAATTCSRGAATPG